MKNASVYHEGYEAGVKATLLELEAGSLHKKARIDALQDRIEALESQLAAVTVERDRLRETLQQVIARYDASGIVLSKDIGMAKAAIAAVEESHE